MSTNPRTLSVYNKKYGKTAKNAKKQQHPYDYTDDFPAKPNLLLSAFNAWNSLSTWRKDIRRNEEFVFGDQHSDKVWDYSDCRYKTERLIYQEQGLNPSQYNIIRNIIRTIVGVWTNNKTIPSCIAQKDENQEESEILTATLHALYRKNDLWKLDQAQAIQGLITGLMVSKPHYANREGQSDIVNDYIDPFTWFVDNTMKDPRYLDCTLVGYYYDLSIDDVSKHFAKGSPARAKKIRELYANAFDEERITQWVETFTDQRVEKDFFIPDVEHSGLVRVYEVWRKESESCFWVHDYLTGDYYPDFERSERELKAENSRRTAEGEAMGVLPEDILLLEWEWGADNRWKYYYLTPTGNVLDEGVNPFWHERPPIVFELHDFYIGKIYPFVKDLIDTNKQINRLSAQTEMMIKFAAKSALFIPVDMIASEDGYGMSYLEKNLSRFDAVIPYKSKQAHPAPEYVNTVAQALTPLNLVNTYLQLAEKTSGVFGALQGQQPTAGTPAQMYAQQSQNSATSLNGIFEAINSYRIRRDRMNVQLMQQYYKGKRFIFDQQSGKELVWDEDRVKNIEFEMTIVENTNTPAYRLLVNDILFQLKQFDPMNTIDLKGIIEVGNLPFKEKLLDYINKREQELQETQQALATGQVPPEATGMPEELQQDLAGVQFAPELIEQYGELRNLN